MCLTLCLKVRHRGTGLKVRHKVRHKISKFEVFEVFEVLARC